MIQILNFFKVKAFEVVVTSNSKIVMVVWGLIFVIFGVRCESKFAESSPSEVEIKSTPLEERLNQKGKVDDRIEEVQKGIEKAKKLVDIFRRLQNPSSTNDIYTPFDFFLDVNSELKSKIPMDHNGKLKRYGKITLPVSHLSEECRTLDTILESSEVAVENSPEGSQRERLTYLMKSCDSQDYIETVIAEWNEKDIEFSYNQENLNKILGNLINSIEMEAAPNCEIIYAKEKEPESVTCGNFSTKISEKETAVFKELKFNGNGKVRFETSIEVYENQKLKSTVHLKVFDDGNTDIKVDPVMPTEESNN